MAHDGRARVQPDPKLARRPQITECRARIFSETVLHLERGGNGMTSRPLERRRSPEQRDDPVTQELGHDPVVTLNRCGHPLHTRAHQFEHDFLVVGLTQRRRPDGVGKQRRDRSSPRLRHGAQSLTARVVVPMSERTTGRR